ncbi:MAG: YybH family protein [Planctomycetota bacterium]|jgi:ketosteroid isomerase-like protein
MNMLKHTAFLATALVAMAACTPAAPPEAPDTSAADIAAIKADSLAWFDLYNAGDADGVAALYAEDGAIMPPNAPMMVGRAAIRDYLASDIENSMEAGITFVGDEVTDGAAGGDTAWITGTFSVNDASGATVDTGKDLTVFGRTNGEWLIVRDIWNSDVPTAPAEAPDPEAQ